MASILLSGGEVFDGTGEPLRSGDVLIADGRIVDVGNGLFGDETVDCSGKVLIPGMFDCHTHMGFPNGSMSMRVILETHPDELVLTFPALARQYLEMGITTVRDAGWAALGRKSAIEKGIIDGPRMHLAISILSATGGHTDTYMPSGTIPFSDTPYPGKPTSLCDGVDECAKKTREVIRAGADVVKICVTGGMSTPGDDPNHATYSEDEIRAFVETAADLDRPVMAHAHGAEGIKRAVRAGVRSIEHGTFLDQEGAEMMVQAGTWLVPTLTVGDALEDWANDPDQPDDVREKMASASETVGKAVSLAVRTGVKIAMGTDCPVAPHGTNLRELEHMVTYGLTPEQSLIAATASAAELLELEADLGTLESGKIADVVIVDGDPFALDTLGDRISQVWKDGIKVV